MRFGKPGQVDYHAGHEAPSRASSDKLLIGADHVFPESIMSFPPPRPEATKEGIRQEGVRAPGGDPQQAGEDTEVETAGDYEGQALAFFRSAR